MGMGIYVSLMNIMTWLKAGKNSAVSTARPAECRFTWTRVRAYCFVMCVACRRCTRLAAVIYAAKGSFAVCVTTLSELRVCVASGRLAGTGPAPQVAQSLLAPPEKHLDPCLNPAPPSVSWHLGSSGFDAGGHLVRGTLDGSWRLYRGMLFRKKRFWRKRTDSDSQKELGIESDQWRELMQEDPDAFLDAALEDPALMKRLFPDALA